MGPWTCCCSCSSTGILPLSPAVAAVPGLKSHSTSCAGALVEVYCPCSTPAWFSALGGMAPRDPVTCHHIARQSAPMCLGVRPGSHQSEQVLGRCARCEAPSWWDIRIMPRIQAVHHHLPAVLTAHCIVSLAVPTVVSEPGGGQHGAATAAKGAHNRKRKDQDRHGCHPRLRHLLDL